MNTKFKSLFHSTVITVVAGLCGLQAAGAATVDLAGVPMVSGVSKVVPPNIYFILDDSGSMNDENMPDERLERQHEELLQELRLQQDLLQPQRHLHAAEECGRHLVRELGLYGREGSTASRAASATVDLSKTVFALDNNPFTTTNGSKTVTVAHSAHGFPVGTIVTVTVFSPAADATFRGVTIVNGNNTRSPPSPPISYTIQVANNATSTGSGGGRRRGNGVVETASYAATAYTWYDYTASPLTPSTTCASDASYTRKVPSDGCARRPISPTGTATTASAS